MKSRASRREGNPGGGPRGTCTSVGEPAGGTEGDDASGNSRVACGTKGGLLGTARGAVDVPDIRSAGGRRARVWEDPQHPRETPGVPQAQPHKDWPGRRRH